MHKVSLKKKKIYHDTHITSFILMACEIKSRDLGGGAYTIQRALHWMNTSPSTGWVINRIDLFIPLKVKLKWESIKKIYIYIAIFLHHVDVRNRHSERCLSRNRLKMSSKLNWKRMKTFYRSFSQFRWILVWIFSLSLPYFRSTRRMSWDSGREKKPV